MKLSDNAIRVLKNRYLFKNHKGQLMESPEQLFQRVAKYIAEAELAFGGVVASELWEKYFYKVLCELKFLPNSPTLMNAGIPAGQLSACFVLPVHDSINGIFTTLKQAALIHQSGGGTGFNFSSIRPGGDFIAVNSGEASGPVSFMKVFDAATENIKQGGKRRGANMGILNIDHPDIEEFIRVKRNGESLRNFNISVGIYDAFMMAVEANREWDLKHPVTGLVVKKVSARDLWNQIIENAWNTGDPGLIFLDTINYSNPTPAIGKINSTNPCGEVPLLDYEACNLGSIDVSKCLREGTPAIDWKELENTIYTAVRFLDNVIEMNDYLLPEIKLMVQGNRKIGLGIMGWAHLLIELEIPYASDEAIILAEQLMKFIKDTSIKASDKLSEERGVFKNWQKSTYYPGTPMRNATCTSIAPTGTISIIADTSSSIEPLFALAVRRERSLNNEVFFEVNPLFVRYLHTHGLYSDELIRHVKHVGTIGDTALPYTVKELFKTATEIEPGWHLKHQIAFQKFTDNAVSKTINMLHTATLADIAAIYTEAWKQKAKGITVFRYGSKPQQVLYMGMQNETTCKICKT